MGGGLLAFPRLRYLCLGMPALTHPFPSELGTEVLEEQRSVEDAVAEIEKRAAIYLAE